MTSFRCWLGWHDWLKMHGTRLTADEFVVEKVCTRCGRAEYAAQ